MRNIVIALTPLLLLPAAGWISPTDTWRSEKHEGFTLQYTDADRKDMKDCFQYLQKGMKDVQNFWNGSFKKEFTVYVHPNRKSMDEQWQKDWKMPEFKSECWMVASGVAGKLDLLSLKKWTSESCEHDIADKVKTQRVVTHELFHVFHGQVNPSPDFSKTEGIDWFVEGLATYASGQCDTLRISEVKKAVAENTIPASLDKFWTGKLKYGLSGTVVMYIDREYGREKLKELMSLTKKQEILNALKITEENLLAGWKKTMQL